MSSVNMATLTIISIFVLFFSATNAITQSQFQCFVCDEKSQTRMGRSCSHDVPPWFQQDCPPEAEGCYVNVYSEKEFQRGCLLKNSSRYEPCKESQDGCLSCETAACNSLNIMNPSRRSCFQCGNYKECAQDIGPSKCEEQVFLDHEFSCYSDFDDKGVIKQKGCTSSSVQPEEAAFRWTCGKDYCNSYRREDHLRCALFKGRKFLFMTNQKDEDCSEKKRDFPGCFYMELENDVVRAGCMNSLTLSEVQHCLADKSICQYCRSTMCNQNMDDLRSCLVIDKKTQKRGEEICTDQSSRCFLKVESEGSEERFTAGCESNAVLYSSENNTFFCKNDKLKKVFCNDPEVLKYKNLGCFACYGESCIWNLKNKHKKLCADNVTHCYMVMGRDNLVQRGCHEPLLDQEGDCEMGMYDCQLCNRNFCNKKPIVFDGSPTEMMPDEEYVYDGHELILRQGLQTAFKCFQCRSDNYYDQSCDDEAQYIEAKPCFHLYGRMPSSCYARYLLQENVIERGCGNDLEPYTFKSCDSNVFRECLVCHEDSCNDMQAYKARSASGNYFDRTKVVPAAPASGKRVSSFHLFSLSVISFALRI